jgi:hypothetical protein
LYRDGVLYSGETVDLTGNSSATLTMLDIGKTYLINLSASAFTLTLPNMSTMPTNVSIKYRIVFVSNGEANNLVITGDSDGAVMHKRIITYNTSNVNVGSDSTCTINGVWTNALDFLELSSVYLGVSSLHWIVGGMIHGASG